MKKHCLLYLIILLLAEACNGQVQHANSGAEKSGNKDFILIIDQSKISKPKDTTLIYDKHKHTYIVVPVKLYNASHDTLAYINMTCSTSDIFTTDQKNIKVDAGVCESNFPRIYYLSPHKASTTNLTLILNGQPNAKITIGIYLCKFPEVSREDFERFLIHNTWPKKYLRWSNDFTIH